MRFESLSDWLAWLEQQHPKEIDLGLERVAAVAARLHLAEQQATVITVAGTNGKGSFVATLAQLLSRQGQSVACYTSPHFLQFNERIDINGQSVSDEALVLAFNAIDAVLEGVSLSYFEYTTLAALFIFKQNDLDYLILEVGLGGRLDAVNIVEPDWAVITSIGIDHQEYLGDNRESIAYEKCGILRDNTPLVCAEIDPPEYLVKALSKRKSLVIGTDYCVQNQQEDWCLLDNIHDIEYSSISDNGLSLPSQSAAIVLANELLQQILAVDEVDAALQSLSLVGRFQRFQENGITTVLDVAHNEQAVKMLTARLLQMPLPRDAKRVAVFNCLMDKDIDAIISLLKSEFSAWFIGTLSSTRTYQPNDIAIMMTKQGIENITVCESISRAYHHARSACNQGDQIIAFGSFYVVSELLSDLQKEILPELSSKLLPEQSLGSNCL